MSNEIARKLIVFLLVGSTFAQPRAMHNPKCRVAWDNLPATQSNILSGIQLPLLTGHGQWADCMFAKIAAEEGAIPELRTYVEVHRRFPHRNIKILVPVRNDRPKLWEERP